MELLFGTTNPGKLRELRRLVAGLPVSVLSPGDLGSPLPEIEEDGATFEENAVKKAVEWARFAGLHAVADDSGLCVDGLGAAPGVRSARWSEEDPARTAAAGRARRGQQRAPALAPRRQAGGGAGRRVQGRAGARRAGRRRRRRGSRRLPRQDRCRAARGRWLRLRPALPSGRPASAWCRRRLASPAHHGGADGRGEGRHLAPRRGLSGAAPLPREARAERQPLTNHWRETKDGRSFGAGWPSVGWSSGA